MYLLIYLTTPNLTCTLIHLHPIPFHITTIGTFRYHKSLAHRINLRTRDLCSQNLRTRDLRSRNARPRNPSPQNSPCINSTPCISPTQFLSLIILRLIQNRLNEPNQPVRHTHILLGQQRIMRHPMPDIYQLPPAFMKIVLPKTIIKITRIVRLQLLLQILKTLPIGNILQPFKNLLRLIHTKTLRRNQLAKLMKIHKMQMIVQQSAPLPTSINLDRTPRLDRMLHLFASGLM